MCPRQGQAPVPVSLATKGAGEVLRLLLPVPVSDGDIDIGLKSWGLTLGYSLRLGMRHLFMLDGAEIEFELEGPWPTGDPTFELISLSFIDPTLGGTGYLRRIAEQFHLVAQRAIDHLDHPRCETACYRC